jgi:TetR/AcrR family transcriptional regulator, repressor of fatR-cypB operon
MTKQNDRRDAILEAMLDLVAKRGFHDAPMSALAKKSGASPGVIYHYFPSKEELIRAAYRRAAAIKNNAFFRGYSRARGPREALLEIWLNAYDFYRKHKREARFLEQYEHSPYCRTDREQAMDASDPVRKQIVAWMRPKKHGGLLKDLPPEAIDSLTLGLAENLAKAPRKFSRETLSKIALAVWTAIVEQ